MKFKDNVESGADSKHFLKLKNHKDSAVGVFCGDPFEFKQHWMGNRSQVCVGNGCDLCAKGNRPSFRFRVNFVIKENNIPVSKIWEQGSTVYGQLRVLNEQYPLEKNFMKITRNGTTKDDTSYSILPIPNGAVNAEQKKMLGSVQLHDLQNFEAAKEDTASDSHHFDNSIPF